MRLIYKAINIQTLKVYIGQTGKNLFQRKAEHYSTAKTGKYKFSKALRKYGKEMFSWEILEIVPDDLANVREQYYIAFFDSVKNGYNSTSGGQVLFSHSKETKEKISNLAIERYKDDVARQKQSVIRKTFLDQNPSAVDGIRKSVRTRFENTTEREKHGLACSQCWPSIRCIETGEIFVSQQEAARKLGLKQGNISSVLKGLYGHTGGYTFERITKDVID